MSSGWDPREGRVERMEEGSAFVTGDHGAEWPHNWVVGGLLRPHSPSPPVYLSHCTSALSRWHPASSQDGSLEVAVLPWNVRRGPGHREPLPWCKQAWTPSVPSSGPPRPPGPKVTRLVTVTTHPAARLRAAYARSPRQARGSRGGSMEAAPVARVLEGLSLTARWQLGPGAVGGEGYPAEVLVGWARSFLGQCWGTQFCLKGWPGHWEDTARSAGGPPTVSPHPQLAGPLPGSPAA